MRRFLDRLFTVPVVVGPPVVTGSSVLNEEPACTREESRRTLKLAILSGGGVLLGSALGCCFARRTVRRRYDVDPEELLALLQDRTHLTFALDELREQREKVISMRRETHEFDNLLHVVAGLLALGRQEEAAALLGESLGSAIGERDTEEVACLLDDPSLAALLVSLTRRARTLGVTLHVAEDSRACNSVEDGARITVLGNLVTNAIESARSETHVYVAADGEEFMCLVEDDGPGVSPAMLSELFTEGASSKAPGAHGRGIGLHLVGSLVASRGGEITVGVSELGGAAFEVHLPAGNH